MRARLKKSILMIEIDFNDLLDNYDTRLLDDLRGFGKGKDYLKFYVPGTSPLKSFMNLCDALFEAKHLSFAVFMDQNNLENNLINNIYNFLNNISSYNKKISNDKLSLIVDLNELKYQEHLKTSKIETVKNNEPIIDLKDQINIFKSTKNIEDIYLKNLEKINPKNFYFIDKKTKNSYTGYFREIELYFNIENRIIVECGHNYGQEDTKKIIDCFLEVCLNKNIQRQQIIA